MGKNTITDIESRQSMVKEAVGLCIMSGAEPDDTFDNLLQKFVSGEMSLKEIREKVISDAQMHVARNVEHLDGTGTYSQRS